MEGIASMEQDREPDELRSDYGDTVHHWKVYKSNIVGLGESSEDMRATPYWMRSRMRLRSGLAIRTH
ncbi:hypothetical protein [Paenibacillus thiaminolyticus]|uniref:hypothetical protein n=1 Tax=Paenibacillus thiaminolyticus TaxID=49283 RepID=UPI0028739F18|nr:hypothetical protein [Paenibacillus thiaminolyticus]